MLPQLDLTDEQRGELLRVRLGRRIRCGMQWTLARPNERAGCYWLWKCGGTFSYQCIPIPFMSPVTVIYIRRPDYSDNEMQYLSRFEKLLAVDVGGTQITERGVEYLLASRDTLKYLFLWGTDVADTVVSTLTKFHALEMLSVSGSRISSDGFSAIGTALPNCLVTHDVYGEIFNGLRDDRAVDAWRKVEASTLPSL